jgi:hypothetical protein
MKKRRTLSLGENVTSRTIWSEIGGIRAASTITPPHASLCVTCLHDQTRRSLTHVHARCLFTARALAFSHTHYARTKIPRT